MANSVFVNLAGGSSSSSDGFSFTNPVGFPDGTAPLPSIYFNSERTLGLWRSAAATITAQATTFTVTGSIGYSGNINGGTSSLINWSGTTRIGANTGSQLVIQNNAATVGSVLNVGALPTIQSGFGTSPSITAGSTPLAGSVNVGTGGVATTGVINFNGTAFPSAPFVVCMNDTSIISVKASASTTQLTITSTTPFNANDIVSWICISSK